NFSFVSHLFDGRNGNLAKDRTNACFFVQSRYNDADFLHLFTPWMFIAKINNYSRTGFQVQITGITLVSSAISWQLGSNALLTPFTSFLTYYFSHSILHFS